MDAQKHSDADELRNQINEVQTVINEINNYDGNHIEISLGAGAPMPIIGIGGKICEATKKILIEREKELQKLYGEL